MYENRILPAMMDLSRIAPNLEKAENGVWVSKSHHNVSYPEEGNARAFEIEENSFWFEHRNRCIAEAVRRFPLAGPLFDIGGGNGHTCAALMSRGVETVLVEPGITGVKNALKRNVKSIIHSRFEDVQFEPESLPAVGLFDVLEHIENDALLLKTIKKSLSPQGKVFLTVPAFQFLWSSEDVVAKHFRRYTIRGLDFLLKSAGLEVDYATYIFWPLPLPIFLFRTIPSRLGLRKGVQIEATEKEHGVRRGWTHQLITKMLSFEVSAVRNGRQLPFGASCLVVARQAQ